MLATSHAQSHQISVTLYDPSSSTLWSMEANEFRGRTIELVYAGILTLLWCCLGNNPLECINPTE